MCCSQLLLAIALEKCPSSIQQPYSHSQLMCSPNSNCWPSRERSSLRSKRNNGDKKVDNDASLGGMGFIQDEDERRARCVHRTRQSSSFYLTRKVYTNAVYRSFSLSYSYKWWAPNPPTICIELRTRVSHPFKILRVAREGVNLLHILVYSRRASQFAVLMVIAIRTHTQFASQSRRRFVPPFAIRNSHNPPHRRPTSSFATHIRRALVDGSRGH